MSGPGLPTFEGPFVKDGPRFAYVLKTVEDPYSPGGRRQTYDFSLQLNGHGRPDEEMKAVLDVVVNALNGQEPAAPPG